MDAGTAEGRLRSIQRVRSRGVCRACRRELVATGETARKRTVETTFEATTEEALIARLASEGYTNPEIGAELFLGPRTVEYHLHKVFTKLGISSRRELRRRGKAADTSISQLELKSTLGGGDALEAAGITRRRTRRAGMAFRGPYGLPRFSGGGFAFDATEDWTAGYVAGTGKPSTQEG